MKIYYKIAAVALILGFAVQANAQVDSNTAQAAIGATIIAPLTVTKNADMNFGSIAPAVGASDITLGTDGTVSTDGGATIIGSSGASAASFTVTGADLAYAITLPTATILIQNGTGGGINLRYLTDSKGGSSSISGGSDTFTVGATLNTAPGQYQSAGVFTGSFEVVVNYQ